MKRFMSAEALFWIARRLNVKEFSAACAGLPAAYRMPSANPSAFAVLALIQVSSSYHLGDFRPGFAGFQPVGVHDRLFDHVEHVGHAAQLPRFPGDFGPRVVDHEHAYRRHPDFVSGHGDYGGRGNRLGDFDGHLAVMVLEGVVNAGRRCGRTAPAVDPDGDVLARVLPELFAEQVGRGRREAEPFVDPDEFVVDDVAVDPEFDFVRGGLVLDEIPELIRRHYLLSR
jgi:hypothetical protein